MTCKSNDRFYQWTNEVPISFTQWKTVISKSPMNEHSKLSSPSELQHQSRSQLKKQKRITFPRNQVFNDAIVDSFFTSSSTSLSRQDVPKLLASSSKRYVSSFKTHGNSTNIKQTQRLNYINDSVAIVKLMKYHPNDNSTIIHSQLSNKHSILSTATTIMSAKQQLAPPPSPIRFSPVLKIEGQKHRIAHHDFPIIIPSTVDISLPTNQMATSTSSHPQTTSSVFTYRSAAAGGNTVRQRAIAETTSNSLLISAERFKSNMSTTIRQTRQPLTTTTTTLSSTYISSQPSQRNIKSRIQQEKITNSRDIYEYPDPFTNCPQDLLSKLAQLTKLQLETIDWEKKKRFTKKKPLTNGTGQGKESP